MKPILNRTYKKVTTKKRKNLKYWQVKVIGISLMLLAVCGNLITLWEMYVPEVTPKALAYSEKEPSVKEYIFNRLQEEIGFDAAIKGMVIINCESKFNPEARYINVGKKNSVDRGVWMLNDYYHKEVSNACAYDYKCATEEAIRIYKKNGNSFNAWVCNGK